MTTRLILCQLLILVSINGSGQYQSYKYKRALTGIKDQWHQLVLPNDIFGKVSNDFSDVRIIGIKENKDTIEAPYVLNIAMEKNSDKDVPFKLINQSKTGKGFYYSFEITGEQEVNELNLDFKQQNFDWKISVEGSHDQQQWFMITDDYRILSIKNEQTQFRFTKVVLPTSRYRYYRLFVNAVVDPGLIKVSLSKNEKLQGEWIDYRVQNIKIDNGKKSQQTIVDVDLGKPLPVSFIKVFVKNNYDYYRPIAISYISDSFKTDNGWHYNYSSLGSGTLNSFEKNEFTFNSTVLQKIEIIIANQDNEPLQVDSIQVKGFEHIIKARFVEAADYYLLYGNSDAVKPNYDIEHFKEKIPASLSSLTLGDEMQVSKNSIKAGGLFQNKAWLWLIMGIIIVLLGWFTVGMMRKSPDGIG